MDKKKNKGFTLVELIVVLAILAILAAMLVPALTGYIDKANEKKVIATARQYYTGVQALSSEMYAEGEELFFVKRDGLGKYSIQVGEYDINQANGGEGYTKITDQDNKYIKTLDSYVNELGNEYFSFSIDNGKVLNGFVVFDNCVIQFSEGTFNTLTLEEYWMLLQGGRG